MRRLWPTPRSTDSKQGSNKTGRSTLAQANKAGWNLLEAVRMSEITGRMWPTPNAMDGERPLETPTQWRARQAQKKAANPNLGGLHRPLTVAILEDEPVPTVSPQLTLFAEAFPASRTPSLAAVPAPTTSATSGRNLLDSFASLDLDGSWRKTCRGYSQVTLDGSLERFSQTWPRAGMTRNGIAYQRVPLAPLTDATAFGSSPIPTATTQDHFSACVTANRKKEWTSHPGTTLLDYARMWPTPTVQDASNNVGSSQFDRNSLPLNAAVGGSLNPDWVEWLMAYPIGWTACAAWGTRSSRRSRNGSRGASSKRKREGDTERTA
jgi:hypothetical protein